MKDPIHTLSDAASILCGIMPEGQALPTKDELRAAIAWLHGLQLPPGEIEHKVFDCYQGFALTTKMSYTIPDLVYLGLKLNGEAGEAAEKIGKLYRDHAGVLTPEYAKSIALEIGDVCWYAATISDALGYQFSSVIELNIEKLRSRRDRGALHGSGDSR